MAKDQERERRLAEALRGNLRRRKQQQRGAGEGASPAPEQDPSGGEEEPRGRP